MCRVHQTECIKAARIQAHSSRRGQRQQGLGRGRNTSALSGSTSNPVTSPRDARTQQAHAQAQAQRQFQAQLPNQSQKDAANHSQAGPGAARNFPLGPSTLNPSREQPNSAVSLDTTEEENPHIIGPATASDSHFLEDYLSNTYAKDSNRIIRPTPPGVSTAPVVFLKVKKRPVGLSKGPSLAESKLETILKLLEPHQDEVMKSYFDLGNAAFPILHKDFCEERILHSRVSPAVLASMYAHAMCYWNYNPELSRHHRPDDRFIWNLALEALYSELHTSPGIPSIIAILLNIGGRPTTTMVGNGMLLGCAVSLAKSLGLNRNPMQWAITQQEKLFRVNLWWCLFIHDRWTSLTHGTPPHIHQSHHDVPLPEMAELNKPLLIFKALADLTNIIGAFLEKLYDIGGTSRDQDLAARLSSNLATWTDSLSGEVRNIIVRGNDLSTSGAANLRLCYLAARFFALRLELNTDVDQIVTGQAPDERVLATRRAVEDIVLFAQELSSRQLGDFWLPTAAFVFSSAITFLIRLTVQTELPSYHTTGQSLSLSLSRDLISSLRAHQETHGWELGDICLSQYGEIADKLWEQRAVAEADMSWLESTSFISDPLFLDSVIDQWDPSVWS